VSEKARSRQNVGYPRFFFFLKDENDDSTNASLKSLANSEPASRASKNTSFINRDFIAE
jgi:hypothetical protein